MNPKPDIRTSRSGWLGRRATRLKCLAAVGAVTLGCAGAAIVAATPASADPAFQFIQVGSDTTEFVMDAFANTVGGGIIGTYDAVNPLTQIAGETITPQLASSTSAGAYTSCSFTRPNGSGGGFKAMAYAYTVGTTAGTTTLGQTGTPPEAGCISLSRSSSPPGSVSATAGTPGSLLTTGNFVYIPFAVDVVTYATGPTTATSETIQCLSTTTGCGNVGTNGIGTITFTTTPTTIPQTLNLSLAQLQTLYTDCASVTVGSTTLNPGTSFSFTSTSASPAVFTTATASNLTAGQTVTLSGTVPTGFTAGTPYFVVSPTSTTFELAATSGGTAIAATSTGSGTVDVAGNIDLYAPQAGSGTLAYWELTMGVSAPQACWHQTIIAGPGIGIAVEEHDGSAFASDPNGIGPISAGRWVAAKNAVDPDLRHGDVLQDVTASNGTVVAPLNTAGTINVGGCLSGTSFSQAGCFPLTRELYNVMDYYEVVNTTPGSGIVNNPAFNSVLSGLFAGGTSSMCRAAFTIEQQGFATISSTSSFTDLCGATTSDLRVQMNNSASEG